MNYSHSFPWFSWLFLCAALSAGESDPSSIRAGSLGLADPSVLDDGKAAVLRDWLLQDCKDQADGIFTHATSSEIEAATISKALQECGKIDAALLNEGKKLVDQKAGGKDPRWKALYVKVCEKRRAMRLKPMTDKWKRFVFAKHYNLGGSHYAYTEGQSDAQAERQFSPGSALCTLEMDGVYAKVKPLLSDDKGVFRNPDVSFDGKRVLFSFKASDRQDDYHLYELDVAKGGKPRPITSGLGFADYEGCYLPNGDIIFNSTRCVQTVDCWWTEVSNIYTCDVNGRYLRRLGFDQVHTSFPTVLDDGRVIYTRWDYNDRGQMYPQPLFQMYPDGTNQTEFYGNNSWFPTTIIHARGISGTGKVLAVLNGHHTAQGGKLAIIDPSRGRQETSGVQLIAPVRPCHDANRGIDGYGQDGDRFQFPYPIDEKHFLVSYAPFNPYTGNVNGAQYGRAGFGIYFMDIDGHRELLAWDRTMSCNQIIPVAARPVPHVRPSMVDYRKPTGTFYVQDVYLGPGLQGVPRGTIKSLRVVSIDYRAAGIGSNSNGGVGGGAMVSTPISINNGSWDVKRIIGTVPVDADGSVYFTAPARTPVYFQLLDDKNCVVQSMRTWATLMPGENAACIGCHENKDQAPPAAKATSALRKGPKALTPFYGPVRGFSYPKEIQPIWDKFCISCHNGAPGKASSLLGREGQRGKGDNSLRQWSESYLTLTRNGTPNEMVNWLNVQSAPPMLSPYVGGAAKSKVFAMLADGSHYKTKLPREALDKIACWIDLLVPYCGDYTEAASWSPDEQARYKRFMDKRQGMEMQEIKNIRQLIAERGVKTEKSKKIP